MWKVEKRFAVRLGSNTYVNTPNLIDFRGTPVFRMRRNEDDGMLGIDFNIYDANRELVAVFAKGVVVQGDEKNYHIESGHDVYSVTERSTGRVIARVQRRGVQGAELDVHVHMYMPNGFLLDAGPESTNLGSNSISNSTFEDCGAGIAIV